MYNFLKAKFLRNNTVNLCKLAINILGWLVSGSRVGHAPLLGYNLLDGHIKVYMPTFSFQLLSVKKFFRKKVHVNFSTAVAFFQNLCQRLNVPSNYRYKNISKELCDSSTYIASWPS